MCQPVVRAPSVKEEHGCCSCGPEEESSERESELDYLADQLVTLRRKVSEMEQTIAVLKAKK